VPSPVSHSLSRHQNKSTPKTAPATWRAHKNPLSATVETIDVTGGLFFSLVFSRRSVTSFSLDLAVCWPRNILFTTSESGAHAFGKLLDAVEVVDLANEVDLANQVQLANQAQLANQVDLSAHGHSVGEFVEYDTGVQYNS